MQRLIDANEIEELFYKQVENGATDMMDAFDYALEDAKTIEAVPLNDIYRVIAGHSDYHGDNILAALTCIAEGKTVNPVKPLEAEPVRHGDWYGCGNMWMCTECNDLAYIMHNYCPNCGARMDGDKDV